MKETIVKAVENNNLVTIPALRRETVLKYMENSEHTCKGHMTLVRKGIQPTKPEPKLKGVPGPHSKVRDVEIQILEPGDNKNQWSWDLAGKFPYKSSRGNQYIMVMIDYDSNYIHAVALKSRKTADLIQGYRKCQDMYRARGLQARLVKMDNEVSRAMHKYIKGAKLEGEFPVEETRLKEQSEPSRVTSLRFSLQLIHPSQ